MDDIVRENSERLAGLLQGREGWRYGIQDDEGYWFFGVAGAARVTIAPEMDGFLMCLHDQDRGDVRRPSWVIPALGPLRSGWMSMRPGMRG